MMIKVLVLLVLAVESPFKEARRKLKKKPQNNKPLEDACRIWKVRLELRVLRSENKNTIVFSKCFKKRNKERNCYIGWKRQAILWKTAQQILQSWKAAKAPWRGKGQNTRQKGRKVLPKTSPLPLQHSHMAHARQDTPYVHCKEQTLFYSPWTSKLQQSLSTLPQRTRLSLGLIKKSSCSYCSWTAKRRGQGALSNAHKKPKLHMFKRWNQ